jgi:hypothetical protein
MLFSYFLKFCIYIIELSEVLISQSLDDCHPIWMQTVYFLKLVLLFITLNVTHFISLHRVAFGIRVCPPVLFSTVKLVIPDCSI